VRQQYAVSELDTPLGRVRLAASPVGLLRLALPRQGGAGFAGALRRALPGAQELDWLPALDKAARELDEYFRGRRREFGVELDLRGTSFQLRVWHALLEIPFGQTRSYAEIARAVGRPGAARAVGLANGANPVAIVVPCHRVIAADGRLGGFSAGLDAKRRLLALEKSLAAELL
jgi:O-6-methylguanine DNA methyltransferase